MIAGAAIIWLTGWAWVDSVIAIAIGLWVLPRTWMLLRDTMRILLEGAPAGLKLVELHQTLATTSGVAGVHDLHVWISGADDPSATVHVELAPGADAEQVRRALAERLRRDYSVHYVTIQTEGEPCPDRPQLHP